MTELVDSMARQAYEIALAGSFPNGLAMLAVGGFGRRELFPYSDVDILILRERESESDLKGPLSEFVQLLWDSGLRLSHSVRVLAECGEIHEKNVELNISLLDRRLLAGDEELYRKLETNLHGLEAKRAGQLAHHLSQLARVRHGRYQDTFYHLEPDVKETPGGLRDLHLIHWLGKLHKLDGNSGAQLASPGRFLSATRCFLHYRAGRDQNLLSFDMQAEISERLFARQHGPAGFMRDYFQNARAIYNEAHRALDWIDRNETSLMSSFRDWRSRLSNSEFTVSRERLFLRTPALLESDPGIVLRLFEFVARHGVKLAAQTERRLELNRDAFARYAGDKALWPSLRNILSLPHAALALRGMHNAGLIQALFPEWAGIVCLVVPDYYHRYTVDEHTLVTIEKLTELAGAADTAVRRFAEILSEIEDLALLRFALLFHDSGKGWGTGDHSQRSVELARQAMQRIQMPDAQQNAVEFLIEHHLDLSAVMNSRDLNDPSTARALADRIGTIERLKLLAVLTYADISAVTPGAMTPWRLERLWHTYRATHQELVRELETDRIQEVPQSVPDPSAFIRGFPVRYLRTHTAEEIEAHIQLKELSRPTGVAVQIDRLSGVYRVSIVARDMPFLFASLAGAISSFGMDIVKAEAFSNAKGQILDTFVFADPKRTLELNPPEMERLQETLERVALGKLDINELLQSRPAPPRLKRQTVRPAVHFDSESCETATLVEIIAEDRPRLLFDLATTFSSAGCNIDVVLIDTEGRKAIDVFYVASDGKKLTPELERMLERKLLERL